MKRIGPAAFKMGKAAQLKNFFRSHALPQLLSHARKSSSFPSIMRKGACIDQLLDFALQLAQGNELECIPIPVSRLRTLRSHI